MFTRFGGWGRRSWWVRAIDATSSCRENPVLRAQPGLRRARRPGQGVEPVAGGIGASGPMSRIAQAGYGDLLLSRENDLADGAVRLLPGTTAPRLACADLPGVHGTRDRDERGGLLVQAPSPGLAGDLGRLPRDPRTQLGAGHDWQADRGRSL